MDCLQSDPKDFAAEGDSSLPTRSSPPVFHLSLPFVPNVVFVCSGLHPEVRPSFFSVSLLHFLSSFSDLFFFLLLDIGNAVIDPIPVGVRFAIGWLQATSVRTAGFAVVALSGIAPSVQ